MSSTYNLYIDQGTDFTGNVRYVDVNGNYISLAGYSVKGQMQKSWNSANASAVFAANIINAANGVVNLSLTDGDTSNLTPGRYVYTIFGTIGNTTVKIDDGIAVVNPSAMALGITKYGGSAVLYATKAYVDDIKSIDGGSAATSYSQQDIALDGGGAA